MSPSLSIGSGPKLRVSICGAGIAGLVLAITIGKYDPSICIDLYEAHDSIETAGVGITLWQRTHEILIELGLFDEFEQIFTHSPDSSHGPRSRRSDIPDGGYDWFQIIYRHGPSAMHRQHMIAILEKHIPPSCTVHPRKRLVKYTEQDELPTSPIKLEFADGTVAITDVLIGADGIRSAVRKTLFEAASKDKKGGDDTDLKQYIEAAFTGMTIYRCLIPAEALKEKSPRNRSLTGMIFYQGKGRSFITYPIAKGTMINFGAIIYDPSLTGTHYEGSWVCDATRDELVEHYNNFEPDAQTVLELCGKLSKWALHVVKPLPFCVRGNVALIGDACHAMTPHFGAGAGQAIEDAFVLGRLIAHPLTPLSRIPDALRIYQEVRLSFARDIADLSFSTGWMYSFTAPGYYDGSRKRVGLDNGGIGVYEKEGMETLKREICGRWAWLDELKGALEAWEDTEAKLKTLVV